MFKAAFWNTIIFTGFVVPLTLVCALGLAVPEGCDGRVIEAAFDAARPVRKMPDPTESASAGAQLTAEEEADLRKSLEGLGYL